MKEQIDFHLRNGEEYIPLISLLKAVNAVESGSEAQHVVISGLVNRNGNPEIRKRAKIRSGEEIEFENYLIRII